MKGNIDMTEKKSEKELTDQNMDEVNGGFVDIKRPLPEEVVKKIKADKGDCC